MVGFRDFEFKELSFEASADISFFENFPYLTELVGFQTMVILDPYGMTFDAVGVFGLYFQLLLNPAHHIV